MRFDNDYLESYVTSSLITIQKLLLNLINVRPFFALSAPPDWWRWDAEEGHGDPS
jgi:hypothetical protein